MDEIEVGEDPTATRRTFAGFATRISGRKEQRGRFLIETGDDVSADIGKDESIQHGNIARPPQRHKCSFAEFAATDRLRRRKRAKLLALPVAPGRKLKVTDWSHLTIPKPRASPKIEPALLKASNKRPVEFPTLNPAESSAILTRRVITTLLTNAMRKKTPDVLLDQREERACLLLHVAFGLPLPQTIDPRGMKIPDMVGSLSAGLLRKKGHQPVINRIFLLALEHGMERLCCLLIEAGVPRSFDDPIFISTVPMLPSYLILAVALGRSTVVRLMLSRGAHVERKWLGLTPLLLAPCGGHHPKASVVIGRALMAAGADPGVSISQGSLRRLEKMATLMRVEVDNEARLFSHEQVTQIFPLDVAAACGNCDLVIVLLNGMITRPSLIERCRLCLLVQNDLDITIRLLKAGADVGQRDAAGNTPLHMAARCGQTDLLAVLIHAGADIDATNLRGWTPLHEAADNGHRAAVQFLISKGADCAIQSDIDETALQVALRHGIPAEDLVEYFRKPEIPEQIDEIQELIRQVDSFQLSDEAIALPTRRKRRFLIEKLIGLPRQWLSNIGGKEDVENKEC